MVTKTKNKTMPDTYFELVRQFPLTHIRDEKQAIAAQAMIDRLLTINLDSGGEEYLDALTDLFECYENEHEPLRDASEADVLLELMNANRLSQHLLAKKVGIAQSTLSAVLNGTRTLTKEQIVTLARHFHVSPTAFLPV